jgi:TRAP-type C4-dicarboxylate transport system permease small subunit
MNGRLQAVAAGVARCSDRVNRLVEGLLFVIGLTMALLTGVQVFSRYALNHSLFWSEEVGRFCLVWLSFLGATAAYKRRAHIGIAFLVERLPDAIRRFIALLVLLVSLTFFAVLLVWGFSFTWFAAAQKTPALGISKAIPYLVIPVSGAAFLLHGAAQLLGLIRQRRLGCEEI